MFIMVTQARNCLISFTAGIIDPEATGSLNISRQRRKRELLSKYWDGGQIKGVWLNFLNFNSFLNNSFWFDWVMMAISMTL